MITSQQLAAEVDVRLRRQTLSPATYLARCQMLDRDGHRGLSFQDRTHLPFYHYLAAVAPGDSLVVVGFGIGLETASYLSAKPPVEAVLGTQDAGDKYYSPRVGVGNVRRCAGLTPTVFVGGLFQSEFLNSLAVRKWKTAVVCGRPAELTAVCDMLFSVLADDGVIAVEGTRSESVKTAFNNFCAARNRPPAFVGSRYGHGIAIR